MKKIGIGVCFLLSFLLLLGGMTANAVNISQTAATQCETYDGDNREDQSYSRWASPVKSYLVPVSEGLMRVQAGHGIDGVLVEYYDSGHNILPKKTKHLTEELPVFGAFYAGANAYFLLTGQNNPTQSAGVEVFRLTKFSKSWERLSSVSLSDCNTTVPFDAGSARMEEFGDRLVVHTCHEMYKSNDGLNHQSNLTFLVDTGSMKILDSRFGVSNKNLGYVSHSFNQFVHVVDGKIVTVDHGDAYPRSIVLLKYPGNTSVSGYGCSPTDVLTFPGDIGENVTGATVGAFEVSSSSYLIAGNSVKQDENNLSRKTRNVFVASVDRSSGAVSFRFVTSHAEGEASASTPHMVKLSTDRYLLLWSEGETVFYVVLDGKGNQQGSIRSMDGSLSDCVPVVANGKITWLVWEKETITFYDISASDLSKTYETVIKNGHHWEQTGSGNGTATITCSVCGSSKTVGVASSFTLYGNTNGGNSYSTLIPNQFKVGDTLHFTLDIVNGPTSEEVNREWTVTVSDESKISYRSGPYSTQVGWGDDGSFTMLAPGKVTVTIAPKYNAKAAKKYEWTIVCAVHGGKDGKEYTLRGVKEATCTAKGYTGDKICSLCGAVMETGKEIAKLGHKTELRNVSAASCTATGYTGDEVCRVCGTVVKKGSKTAKLPHNYKNGKCTVCGALDPATTGTPGAQPPETAKPGTEKPPTPGTRPEETSSESSTSPSLPPEPSGSESGGGTGSGEIPPEQSDSSDETSPNAPSGEPVETAPDTAESGTVEESAAPAETVEEEPTAGADESEPPADSDASSESGAPAEETSTEPFSGSSSGPKNPLPGGGRTALLCFVALLFVAAGVTVLILLVKKHSAKKNGG